MGEAPLWNNTRQDNNLLYSTRKDLEKERVLDKRKLSDNDMSLVGYLGNQDLQVSDRLRSLQEFPLLLTIFKRSILDAIQCARLRDQLHKQPSSVRANLLAAAAWTISAEEDWLYSLRCACSVLGFNSSKIQTMIFTSMEMSPDEVIALLRKHGWKVNENTVSKK